MTQDDIYLLKLLNAGLPRSTIATKLGISTAEVERRWQGIQQQIEILKANGHVALCDQFSIMCNQYQLVGESLKIIGAALSNEMPSNEIRALITPDVEETVKNLKRSCIILRPFSPVDPVESLKETTKQIQAGN